VGFLLKDGTIVDSDGSSDLAFSVAAAGDYYIVVRHRNHLAIMSHDPVSLPNSTVYDLSTAQIQAYGTNPLKLLTTGLYGMYVGDYNLSNSINSIDWSTTNGCMKESGTAGYKQGDFNFTGSVNSSDKAFAKPNSGLSTWVP
jgi:hypothetical protein